MQEDMQIGEYKLQSKVDSTHNRCLWTAWSDISQREYILLLTEMHDSFELFTQQSRSEETQAKFKHLLLPVHVFQYLLKDILYLVQVTIHIGSQKLTSNIQEIPHKCTEKQYMLRAIDYCLQTAAGFQQIIGENFIHDQLDLSCLTIRDNNVYITGYWHQPETLGVLQGGNSKKKQKELVNRARIKQELAMKSILLQILLKQIKKQTTVFASAELKNEYQSSLENIGNKDLISILQSVFEIIPERQQTWDVLLSGLNALRDKLLREMENSFKHPKEDNASKPQNYVYLIPLICVEQDQGLIDFDGWSTSCQIDMGQDMLQLLFGSEDDIDYLGFRVFQQCFNPNKQLKFGIIYTQDWIQEYLQGKDFTMKEFYDLIRQCHVHIENDHLVIQIQQGIEHALPIEQIPQQQYSYQEHSIQSETDRSVSSSEEQFDYGIQIDSFTYPEPFPADVPANLQQLQDKVLTLEQLKGYNSFSDSLSDEYSLLGRQYFKKEEWSMAEHYYKKSLDYYQMKNNDLPDRSQKLAELYHNFSLLYFCKKRGSQALYYCLQSLKLQQDGSDATKKSETCNLLGLLVQNIDDYELSQKYIKRGIRLIKDSRDSTLARLLNNLGMIKLKKQQYLEACDCLQLSTSIFQGCKNEQNVDERSRNFMNLATAYSFIAQMSKTFFYLRKCLSTCRTIEPCLKRQAIKTLIRLLLKLNESHLPIDRPTLKTIISDFNLEADCPQALLLLLN